MNDVHGVVVTEDPAYLDWLEGALGGAAKLRLAQPIQADELIELVQGSQRADVVFVQVEQGTLAARCHMIEVLTERFADLPVVGVGPQGDPEVVLAAMRAGARDFFVLHRDDAQLKELLEKVMRRSVSNRAATQGKLFSVVSGHPYDGVAFLAQHLGLACHERQAAGARVVLVDASAPVGASAVYLNISQPYNLLDAVNDLGRCDQTLVETAFPKHNSGMYVLSLPEDLMGPSRLNHEELVKLLEVFRSLFAVTVVTLDSTQPMDYLTSVISQSDRSLVLSDQSVLKSRHNKYLLRSLRMENCELDHTGLVVDNYRRRLGLEPTHLAELLELPLLATLSGHGVNRIQAMNSGESMFESAPNDSYCKDIRSLAQILLGGSNKQTVTASEPGLLARLFS